MRRFEVGGVIAGVVALSSVAGAAALKVTSPLVCNRGPADQRYEQLVEVPATVMPESEYTIKLGGTPSGKISDTGLNYLHSMRTDYAIPGGTSYVPGSARVIPGTGSENVRAGAEAIFGDGVITLSQPAHVDNGSEYTPPSLEFRVKVTAPAGAQLPLGFLQYRLKANAFLVGDLSITCDPQPRPFILARTKVVAP
jgi:hypothetical protein